MSRDSRRHMIGDTTLVKSIVAFVALVHGDVRGRQWLRLHRRSQWVCLHWLGLLGLIGIVGGLFMVAAARKRREDETEPVAK